MVLTNLGWPASDTKRDRCNRDLFSCGKIGKFALMKRFRLILCAVVLSVEPAVSQDHGAVYSSLDEAIESEIEGIDFSDMSSVGDYAICGMPVVDADALTAFVRRHNPSFDHEISQVYIEVGRLYGIRGDIAFCQAILETGWFRFDRGTSVDPSHHNYCGLGVVRRGAKGARFATVREGVTAHIQHLYAYATDAPLPDGETLIDPRFRSVRRGVAVEWSDLNNRWAMNHLYGSRILKIFADLTASAR